MSLLNIKIDFLNLTKLFNFIIGGKDSYNKHSGELLAKRNDELDRNLIELLGNVKLSIANESLIYEENSLPQIFYLYDFLIKYEKRYCKIKAVKKFLSYKNDFDNLDCESQCNGELNINRYNGLKKIILPLIDEIQKKLLRKY